MISKWIPKNEKSQLFNLIWAGEFMFSIFIIIMAKFYVHVKVNAQKSK